MMNYPFSRIEDISLSTLIAMKQMFELLQEYTYDVADICRSFYLLDMDVQCLHSVCMLRSSGRVTPAWSDMKRFCLNIPHRAFCLQISFHISTNMLIASLFVHHLLHRTHTPRLCPMFDIIQQERND